MKNRYESVAYGGMDVHYKSSHVTLRDAGGAVVARERLDQGHSGDRMLNYIHSLAARS